MDNDLQKTLDFYKKRVEELEKVVVEINKSKFDKLMEKDILFHLKKELEEKDKEINDWKQCFNSSEERNKVSTLNGAITLELKDKRISSLEKQLHTQPKEIVEKIRKEFEERLKNMVWDETLVVGKVCNVINDVLDKILKEYEEKRNENLC